MHQCPDCGLEHEPVAVEPEPAPVIVEPGPNENDVRIAEIEAEASVKREELYTQQQALELVAENERLRGELKGAKEILDRLQPPEPEPVVIVPPEPAPVAPAGPDVPAPPVIEDKAAKSKGSPGWWDGYR